MFKKFLKKFFITVFFVFLSFQVYAINFVPGERTIKNLIQVAFQPVGNCIYIWGGGWQEQKDFVTEQIPNYGSNFIGVHPLWKLIYNEHKDDFYSIFPLFAESYVKGILNTTNYGLDCSGFVSWIIYNVMENKNGNKGYTCLAMDMAKKYSERGWGNFISSKDITEYKAGDILSGSKNYEDPIRHVILCLGQCSDKSVLFVHSSPPGVSLFGTSCPISQKGDKNSEAYKIALSYMIEHHKDFCTLEHKVKNGEEYVHYIPFFRDWDWIKKYNLMRWDVTENGVLKDPDDFMNKDAGEIISIITGKNYLIEN